MVVRINIGAADAKLGRFTSIWCIIIYATLGSSRPQSCRTGSRGPGSIWGIWVRCSAAMSIHCMRSSQRNRTVPSLTALNSMAGNA
eukprot:3199587-Pleurochrysis_carterae.AAC.2